MTHLMVTAPPDAATHMTHLMTPTAVATLLMLALFVDYLSVGPDSIRDRIAFVLALPAVYEGFNGSPLDNATVGFLSGLIQQLLNATGGAYIAGAIVNTVLGAAIALLFFYTIAAILPDTSGMSKAVGRFVKIKFPKSPMYRLNYKLWACAFLLGMCTDLAHGYAGALANGILHFTDYIISPWPGKFFGSV